MADLDPRLVDFVVGREGFRAEAYQDRGGTWTYGHGFTTRPDGTPVRQGDTVGEADSYSRLERVLLRLRKSVDQVVTAEVEPHVLDACTSLTYNIGLAAFRDSTCLRRLNEGDLVAAATALKAWNKVTVGGKKVVDKGLVNRRAREAQLMLDGWPLPGQVTAVAGDKPLAQSRTMAGGAVAAIGSAVVLAGQIKDMVEAAQPLLSQQPLVLALTAAIALAGAAYAMWARWDDHQKAAA